MKKILLLLVFCFVSGFVCAQKTLLVEKIGSPRRYFYHTGDYIKLRVSKQDTLLKGKLWAIRDSSISVSELRPFDVRLGEIGSVYKQFSFPKKFGRIVGIGGVAIFAIVTFNHLINNEQVFTPDMFIISGSMLGAGIISISLSQKRCNTGKGWKIKVLDVTIN
ncbi:MAG: hypothetical protein ACOYNC_04835 [Bacteroidales bacterium]